jgi:hypothetical protein
VTNGHKLIAASFVLAYAIPAAGNLVFGDAISTIYRRAPLTPYAVLLLAGVYVAFLALSAISVRVFPTLRSSRIRSLLDGMRALYLSVRLLIAIAALLLQALFLTGGLNSYRYSAAAISEVGSPLLFIGAIANVLITVDLFYWMFVRPDVAGVLTRRYLENVLLSLTLVISANGTASMLLALVALSYSMFPVHFKRFVFVRRGSRLVRRVGMLVAAVALLAVIFPIAWFSGETIKASSTGDVTLVTAAASVVDRVRSDDRFLENYLYYFVSSISSYYYSFLFTVETPRNELRYESVSPLMLPIETFLFRLDYLLGGPYEVERPAVASLSQWNYVVMTSDEQSSRVGTSPGVLASFTYVFGFPLNVLLCAVYLHWVSKATNLLVARHGSAVFSECGVLLFLLFVYDVFQSPFDILIVFDNSVLYRLLLVGLVITQWTRQHEPVLSGVRTFRWAGGEARA